MKEYTVKMASQNDNIMNNVKQSNEDNMIKGEKFGPQEKALK